MIVLVMGVSGSGKTTIGEALARELGWKYLDADDYHPRENIAKMAAGIPLEDSDRGPWLEKINEELLKIQKQGESAVVGCSALKQAYRERLARRLREFEVVYLRGDFELLESRIAARKHRYMPASLLQSQFDTLEPPAHAIEVDVSASIERSVAKIKKQLPQK
jgi:carbohydrate kinase (thermoresistant glucokinase family)